MGGYLAYTEYKDSGVEWLGKIPTHWDAKRIKFVVSKVGSGKTPRGGSEVYIDAGIMMIRSQNVYDDGLRLDDVVFITEDADSLQSASRVYPNDVLLNITGASIGRSSLVPDFFGEANVNQHVCIFRPQTEKITPKYLHLCLCSKQAKYQIFSYENGISREGLNFQQASNLIFAVPPLEEQRSIARFLDYKTAQIDALIAKKETLLKKLAEKRTALISQAVTKGLDHTVPMKDSGIEWLGDIPAHWELVQMRRRWKVIDCKHKTVEFIDEGFPIASIGEVRDHRFNLEQAKKASLEDYLDLIDGRKPEKNDLIYSRNATVGCVGFVDENVDFCLGQDVCLIKTSTENNRFLWWQLQSISLTDQLQSIFVGATFKRINVANIKAYLICCPPADEQQDIAQYLDEKTNVIDQQKIQIEEAISKLKEYRTALITNAVTGKIDVRDVVLELEPVEAA